MAHLVSGAELGTEDAKAAGTQMSKDLALTLPPSVERLAPVMGDTGLTQPAPLYCLAAGFSGRDTAVHGSSK